MNFKNLKLQDNNILSSNRIAINIANTDTVVDTNEVATTNATITVANTQENKMKNKIEVKEINTVVDANEVATKNEMIKNEDLNQTNYCEKIKNNETGLSNAVSMAIDGIEKNKKYFNCYSKIENDVMLNKLKEKNVFIWMTPTGEIAYRMGNEGTVHITSITNFKRVISNKIGQKITVDVDDLTGKATELNIDTLTKVLAKMVKGEYDKQLSSRGNCVKAVIAKLTGDEDDCDDCSAKELEAKKTFKEKFFNAMDTIKKEFEAKVSSNDPKKKEQSSLIIKTIDFVKNKLASLKH